MPLPLVLAITSLASTLALTAQSSLDSHLHQFGNCEGAPDGVYMRSGTSYYACINRKNVCKKALVKFRRI